MPNAFERHVKAMNENGAFAATERQPPPSERFATTSRCSYQPPGPGYGPRPMPERSMAAGPGGLGQSMRGSFSLRNSGYGQTMRRNHQFGGADGAGENFRYYSSTGMNIDGGMHWMGGNSQGEEPDFGAGPRFQNPARDPDC
eukprot:gnl/MRDRNA2_/MRDRNA2_91627_c0_seq1.p1 gnl/MRDRNA2_/MRDRNA2_91627_c0~~gnl/MRDRNA2_/MRDRNA2_91627_c0_seq1.p1  ORF type:complete len:142 (-),score=18.14 gnl/MRDRNA2_/MRDRNA2_91627_c0_seq1:80-505(-)